VLTVTRLDRLARSTRDLLNTLATITGKKAGFRSLGDAWADTTTSHGRLMLTVLGGLAEFERDLIRARTSEGRERAKARGVKMGRKSWPRKSAKITPLQGAIPGAACFVVPTVATVKHGRLVQQCSLPRSRADSQAAAAPAAAVMRRHTRRMKTARGGAPGAPVPPAYRTC
jgi:hypothetical protein